MIGVTAFGLIFTPVFYVVCRWLAGVFAKPKAAASEDGPSPPLPHPTRSVTPSETSAPEKEREGMLCRR